MANHVYHIRGDIKCGVMYPLGHLADLAGIGESVGQVLEKLHDRLIHGRLVLDGSGHGELRTKIREWGFRIWNGAV